MLAGLSITWYTYLEQGRNVRPSPQVLDSLAKVLCLDEDERRYMHYLVHVEPVSNQPTGADKFALDNTEAMVRLSAPSPMPVYAVDESGDLIAWNAATTEWYDDFDALPPADRNMTSWMFTYAKAREHLIDWDQDARSQVARCRVLVADRQVGARTLEVVADLRRRSPDFVRMWSEHEVTGQHTRIRRFRRPGQGIYAMRLMVVRPADDPSISIAFHLPEQVDSALIAPWPIAFR